MLCFQATVTYDGLKISTKQSKSMTNIRFYFFFILNVVLKNYCHVETLQKHDCNLNWPIVCACVYLVVMEPSGREAESEQKADRWHWFEAN